jgi:hypothetical protein
MVLILPKLLMPRRHEHYRVGIRLARSRLYGEADRRIEQTEPLS